MSHNLKKRETSRHISEVIKEMLSGYKLNNKLTNAKVVFIYKNIVGDYIYKNTEEAYVHNNKLYLKINSSVIKAEISINEKEIIKNINQQLGSDYIKEIVFY